MRGPFKKGQRGQIISEYALMMVFCSLLATVMLLVLLSSYTDYGLRMALLVVFHDTFTTN